MRIINSINLYIAKNFLAKFIQITLGFSLLIFLINLIDALDKVKANEGPAHIAAAMALLQIPDFLNDISPSLVLISAIISFFTLSSRSEISIIRMSGFSLWQVTLPITISAFFIGILWITAFNPLSVMSLKKFHNIEGQYVKKDMREIIKPSGGIWIKQDNLEKENETIIIRSASAYKKNLEFIGVTAWFFNSDGGFYKKIDGRKANLVEGSWEITRSIVNEGNISLNRKVNKISIPTDLEPKFVAEKILNNFQNVKLFSIFKLPQLIEDLKSSGFSSLKFSIHFHSLLGKPFLFPAMTLIACYFGLNHVRNTNSVTMIFLGIIIGLTLYITSSIVSALGASGIIPVFVATWLIAIICLAVGILLIYQKERI
jgi:lipopolysaccharide export system permease protein